MTCRQMGGTCDAELQTETSAEMARQMTAHVLKTHPDVANKMKNMTPEEHRRWEADFHRKWDEAHKLAHTAVAR